MGKSHNPFRGLMDHMSEMTRMRQYFEGGGPEDQRRTHATAWVPTADIFAKGDDLVIRCELAGVERDDVEVSLRRRRPDHRRAAQGRTGGRELLRPRALLRALPAEHDPAGGYRRRSDQRRFRKRFAGGHREGRGRPSRAREYSNRKQRRLGCSAKQRTPPSPVPTRGPVASGRSRASAESLSSVIPSIKRESTNC